MNRSLALEFVLYGLILAGMGLLVHQQAPDFGLVTLVAGCAGGAVSLLWGVLVWYGYQRRWWMVLALAAEAFTLLSQAVTAWMQPAGGDGSPSLRPVAAWITVLLVFSFGLLMKLLHSQRRAGVTPDSSPSKPKTVGAKAPEH